MAAPTCQTACGLSEACVGLCISEVKSVHVEPSDILSAILLLMCSGTFSGLTLGVMSLDLRELELMIHGGDAAEKAQAQKIMPVRKRGNLVLCTLLLGNTIVNAGISIFTASFAGGAVGGLLASAFIVIFGEICPQAACQRHRLYVGAKAADLIRLLILCLWPLAYPLSRALDWILGEEGDTIYSRTELKALLAMQAERQKDLGEAGKAGTAMQSRPTLLGEEPTELDEEGAGSRGLGATEATFMCGALSLSERKAEQVRRDHS